MADARVRIVEAGQQRIVRALRGITRAVLQSHQQQQRATRSTTAVVEATERRKQLLAAQTATVSAREAKQILAENTRIYRSIVSEAEKSARAQIQATRRISRESRRAREESRRGGGPGLSLVGGAIGGARGLVQGASGLVARAQSTAGVGSLEERIQRAGSFQEEFIRQSRAAGLSRQERGGLQQRVLRAAEQTNVDPGELMGGLATAQSRFNALRDFGANIEQIARVSKATGSSVEDLVGALGTAQQAFGLSGDELGEFTDVLVGAAARGNIEAGELARAFAPTLAHIQRSTGRTGIAGAREAVGLAELMGTGQMSPDEAATRVERLMTELTNVGTQRKLMRKAGIRVYAGARPGEGGLRPLEEIVSAMATSRQFQSPNVRQQIFSEERARSGAEVLMTAQQRAGAGAPGALSFGQLQNINRAEGAGITRDTVSEITGSEYGRLQNIGVRAQTETIRDADRIISSYRGATEAITRLETRFPLLTESLDTLNSTLQGVVGGALVGGVLRGGGGAGGGIVSRLLGGGGAAVAGGGATAAGGAAAGGGLAAAALPAAGLLAVGGVAAELGSRYQHTQQLQAAEDARQAGISAALQNEDYDVLEVANTGRSRQEIAARRASRRTQAQGAREVLGQTGGGNAPQVRIAREDLEQMSTFMARLANQPANPPPSEAGSGAPSRRQPGGARGR